MFFIYRILLFVIISSLAEWLLHRYVMHKKFLGWKYPFVAHALVHHDKFQADDTYHYHGHEYDVKKIPMAWWNGIVIVGVGSSPAWFFSWQNAVTLMIVFGLYYCVYEYIHYCMHKPNKRWFENTGVFTFLNGHHLLHHRHPDKNFNVVLPFADLIFGTLIFKSKRRFEQAGYPTPDIQPEDSK